MEAILGILLFIIGAVFWLIPVLVIVCSSRTSGGEKAAWILAVIFISWFAWIFYFLLAPLNDNRVRG
ncbi:PLDc N-terminal domain-containing protein [Glaciecola sp. SC05]|uniref:PLDc N-terminal domain-containing protein n=1 Tax=Glaciecola sp. SC05 TaxID=1987355 RepID=UPI0035289D52